MTQLPEGLRLAERIREDGPLRYIFLEVRDGRDKVAADLILNDHDHGLGKGILHLWTQPPWRRRGLASFLLAEAVKRMGRKEMWVAAAATGEHDGGLSQAGLEKLYGRFGFTARPDDSLTGAFMVRPSDGETHGLEVLVVPVQPLGRG